MGEPKIAAEDLASIKEMLQICLLFQEVEDAALEFAAFNLELLTFNKGEPIILENEPNDQVYFIKHGSVEIVSYIPEDKRVQRLALLKTGIQFAEFSILTKSSRSGSAYAYEDCELLCMKGSAFMEMLQRFPTVSMRFIKLIAELNHKNETFNEFVPFYKPSLINLNKEALMLLPNNSWKKFGAIPLSYKANVLKVAMKDPNNAPFFSFIKNANPQIEIAVYLIDEEEFDEAAEAAMNFLSKPQVQKNPAPLRPALPVDDVAGMLRGSDLFSGLPDEILQQIVPLVQPQHVKAGSPLLTPGMELPAYYMIAKGEVQLFRSIGKSIGVASTILLTSGEGLGETQIVTEKPFAGYARVTEDAIILPIQKEIFLQLLPTPHFSIPGAQAIAKKILAIGQMGGFKYFKHVDTIDFKPVMSILPVGLMMEQKMVPLQLIDNEITLGVLKHNNNNSLLSACARYILDYRVKIMGISEEQFKVYFQHIKALNDQNAPEAPVVKNKAANVVQLVEQLLLTGMNNRASDIHFEPSEHYLTVRYRIDGVLRESAEKIPAEQCKELIGRLKILSNMDISQNKIPQDGQLKTVVQGQNILARSSCLPLKYGEKIVLRLIRSKNSVTPLNMLAPDRRTIQLLQAVTHCKQGLFLVTGPTGSGKTTTLYSMLNAINNVNTNVVTLEDPIEMEIPGFNQVEIDRKRGLEFGNSLRSVLRQDPDVVMVGEIRDEESAKIVFDAAITGHLVLSTLHTNSALDVSARLQELGVPSATISAGLLGVLTQRLLRAICKKCVTTRPTTDAEKELFKQLLHIDNPPEELKHGKGCPACSNSGYFDRVPVVEVWRATLPMRAALARGATLQEILEVARQDGFETLLEFGLKMVISGLTTVEEVKRVLSQV